MRGYPKNSCDASGSAMRVVSLHALSGEVNNVSREEVVSQFRVSQAGSLPNFDQVGTETFRQPAH